MADMTDDEEERLEPQPHIAANISAIALLIDKNGRIAKQEEKAAKARGELGTMYQKIENDFHGNRKAAKLVRSLQAGTTDAAYDFMRTFIPLAQHFGLIPDDDSDNPSDLMAKAEKLERETREGDEESSPEPGGQRASALDAARAHLQGGTKPPEPGAEEPAKKPGAKLSIVTGDKPKRPADDSDLADGANDGGQHQVAAE